MCIKNTYYSLIYIYIYIYILKPIKKNYVLKKKLISIILITTALVLQYPLEALSLSQTQRALSLEKSLRNYTYKPQKRREELSFFRVLETTSFVLHLITSFMATDASDALAGLLSLSHKYRNIDTDPHAQNHISTRKT